MKPVRLEYVAPALLLSSLAMMFLASIHLGNWFWVMALVLCTIAAVWWGAITAAIFLPESLEPDEADDEG